MCQDGHQAIPVLKITDDTSISHYLFYYTDSSHVLIIQKYNWKVNWMFLVLLVKDVF